MRGSKMVPGIEKILEATNDWTIQIADREQSGPSLNDRIQTTIGGVKVTSGEAFQLVPQVYRYMACFCSRPVCNDQWWQ